MERFNKTPVQQLRHYVSEHVVTWARYVSLLVTAFNSQVHSSTGEAPFFFLCSQKLSPVAIERLTQGTGEEEPPSTPRQTRENFRKRLDEIIPLVQKSMEKAQARYKRHFDKRVKSRRESLRVGDWVIVKSHENQGGKLIFKTKGPYPILKTDGRRLTIESTDGIRTINGNNAAVTPEPPEGDPAWERALEAWRVPSPPSSSEKKMEAVFDQFVGQGYDNNGCLMLKVRWFGYGPREDTWEYVEDLPTRGFGIMIRIKHRSVSSGILLAATSYGHQSFHEEPEHEVSFPAVSSVLLSHWTARRVQRIYPDISGYIPDSAEKPGF